MSQVESIARAPSIVPADRTVSEFANPWQRILAEAAQYWPRYTAKHLARITGKSTRTCYRWLADLREPDASDLIAIINAMRAEWTQRGRIFEQFNLDLR